MPAYRSVAAVFVLLLSGLVAPVCAEEPVTVRMQPLANAPTIDGRIDVKKEWHAATALAGLQRVKRVDPRGGVVYLGFTDKTLYVAVCSELPPGSNPVVTARKRGDKTWADDSIEMWLAPPGDRPEGLRQFGYFQLIVNSKGVIFDRHHEPGFGLNAKEWKAQFKQAHKLYDDGRWEAEFAIPFSEMGLPEVKLPMTLRLLVGRNFRQPSNQATVTPVVAFTDRPSYLHLQMVKHSPVVRLEPVAFAAGVLPQRVTVVNPTDKATSVKVSAAIVPTDGDPVEVVRTLRVEPGGDASMVLGADYQPAESNSLSIVATGDDATVLYRRAYVFGPRPEQPWDNREAYLVYNNRFEKDTFEAELAPEGLAEPVEKKGELKLVPGRKGHGQAVSVGAGGRLSWPEALWRLPGAVSVWVCPQVEVPEGKIQMYLSSRFKQSGYLWTECDRPKGQGGRLMMGASYFKDMKTQVVIYRNPLKAGTWYHLVVNLHKDRAEMYLDGVKLGKIDLREGFSTRDLSALCLGGGISRVTFDDLQVYRRPLREAEITAMAVGQSPADGRIYHFPSLGQVVVDATFNPEALEATASMHLVISDTAGRQVLSSPIDLGNDLVSTDAGMLLLRKRFDLPKLDDGLYVTMLRLTSRDGRTRDILTRGVPVKQYPWMDNRLGLSDTIVPPFTPLEVEGNTVACVLREYRLGDDGLPAQVKSLGQPVLAAPVQLTIHQGRKRTRPTGGGVRFVSKTKTGVSYTATSRSDVMRVDLRGEFDYDGLLKLTFKLTPEGKPTVDRLTFDIPVRREVARLFHASGEHLRSNPAGGVPAGRGTVWGSRSIPQRHVSNFIPYLWVGGERRGMCYVADVDRGWTHGEDRDAVELVRQRDRVIIRCNLVGTRTVLDGPRTIELCVMASPVKPMPEDWRAWSDNYTRFKLPGRHHFQCLYSPGYWGGFYRWATRYPQFKEWTYFDKLSQARDTGKVDYDYLEGFLGRLVEAGPEKVPELRSRPVDNMRNHIRGGHRLTAGLHEVKGKYYCYTCVSVAMNHLPEYPVMRDEWQMAGRGHAVKSFRDYSVYYAAKMMDHGCDGIYFDNTFFTAKHTWPTGDGWIDDKGVVRPSLGLWRIRKLIKRTATMMAEKGKPPLICVHMTNANVLPTLAFANISLGMEWRYGKDDFQDRFSAEYIRATNLGLQGGFYPTVLDGIRGVDETEKIRLNRTMFAVLLPHEIQASAGIGTHVPSYRRIAQILWDFGRAEKDTTFLPYWDDATPVTPAREDLLVSAYRRGDKLMLVVGNYGGEGTVPIELDLKKLGAVRLAGATNPETGARLKVDDATVHLPIEKHGFALVEVKLAR